MAIILYTKRVNSQLVFTHVVHDKLADRILTPSPPERDNFVRQKFTRFVLDSIHKSCILFSTRRPPLGWL